MGSAYNKVIETTVNVQVSLSNEVTLRLTSTVSLLTFSLSLIEPLPRIDILVPVLA